MPSPNRLACLAFAALTASVALPVLAQVVVTDAWVRGTVAGQQATGAFMQLKAATDTALVAASSPAAKMVEVHEMKMEGSVMRMKAVERLPLPSGQTVELKPGGYHVMLMDLTRVLKDGDIVPVTLTFEDKGGKKQIVDVKATVRGLAAGSPAKKQ